jgi:predicted esterase
VLLALALVGPAAAAEAGRVEVRVVNGAGKALKGVPVVVSVKAWPGGAFQWKDHEGTTDAKGRATLDGVVPGGTRYGVYAAAVSAGHTIASRYLWSSTPAATPALELVVTPASPLRLRFVDAAGKPLAGVRVAPSMRHTAEGVHHTVASTPRDSAVATSGADGLVPMPFFLAGEWVGVEVAFPGERWQRRTFSVPAAKDAIVEVAREQAPTADRELLAGDDPKKRFFFTGPKAGDVEPEGGWGVVLVLPGGDGGEGFREWVRERYDDWIGAGFVWAHLVAPVWKPSQDVVWPIAPSPPDGRTFTTETFVADVVQACAKQVRLDPRKVLAVGWSSSGPALWRLLSTKESPVQGYVLVMSVFHAKDVEPLAQAKGRLVSLIHSPQDETCPLALAEKGRDALKKAGVTADWATYEGGHGWEGESEALVARALARMASQLAVRR